MAHNRSRFFAAQLMLLTVFFVSSLSNIGAQYDGVGSGSIVDGNANGKTKALLSNLRLMAGKGVMFGHQDDLAYGVRWKREDKRSDVKDVSGAYPAVYGWDVSKIELGWTQNIDSVNFDDLRHYIKEAYRRGGVNTISWHMENPVTKGNAWDTTSAVKTILPGGIHHEAYKTNLAVFARYVRSLRPGWFAQRVPIIFRPFHEHTGGWFWWGKGHASPEEYKAIWQFTVTYLRDSLNVHQLLYAYSPDKTQSKEEYLRCYPGDDYVDILGLDNYYRSPRDKAFIVSQMGMVGEIAKEKHKPAALTETGSEGIPNGQWWTDELLGMLKADSMTQRLVYLVVWRNANAHHYYAPYLGHSSAENFKVFSKDPFVILGDRVPRMYEVR